MRRRCGRPCRLRGCPEFAIARWKERSTHNAVLLICAVMLASTRAQYRLTYITCRAPDVVPVGQLEYANQIKSNMILTTVDKPQPSYNLLNMMK